MSETATAEQPKTTEKKKMKEELCVFSDAFIRMVGPNKDKAEIWVVGLQGLNDGKCSGYQDSLIKENEKGTYFTADIEQSRNGKFYRIISVPKKIAEPTDEQKAENKKRFDVIVKEYKQREERAKEEAALELEKQNGVPPIPDTLFIPKIKWNLLAVAVHKGKYPLLLGPKGCGKTEAAEAMANAKKLEFHPFNLGAASKPKQFFAGIMTATEKGTEFLPSDFLNAWQAEVPTMIFLDEITRLPQSASNYLMTILDRKQNYIYVEELGKRIYKSKQVHIIAAANVGMQYTDTRTLDGAFWDRFVKLSMDYLSKEEELKLLKQRVPGAPENQIKRLIGWANLCREKEKGGDLSTGVSTRQIIDMADFLDCGISIDEVYQEIFMHLFINGQQDERDNVKSFISGAGI